MKQIITLLYLCITLLPRCVEAQQVSIKAYVNDHVITNIDIANRHEVLRALGHVEQDEQDTISMLIDEAIILQIAKNNNNALDVQQVNELKHNFALRAGFQNYYDFIKKYKIDSNSLQAQLESSYLMGYFVEHFIKPNIDINEYHIKSNIAGLGGSQAVQRENVELQLSQLVIEQSDENASEKVIKIQKDIKSKIPFSTIIKNYSDSEQYDLGSLRLNQLQKSIRESVAGRKVGDIVGPVYFEKKILFLQINDMKYFKLNNAQINKFLFNAQLMRVVREFIIKYRGEAFIKIL